MKISLNWLNDYVDLREINIEDFTREMTMTGTKVEGYEIEGKDIKDVVVGKVLSIKKHENADKLVVCTVDVGIKKLTIVTGAKNIVEGAKVPVCLDGGELPGGVKIKKGELRGIESDGMMCSIGELGLSKDLYPYIDENGIFLIKDDCKEGDDIKQVLGLNDKIVDFEITSNRPDCLSVRGIAREAAATFNIEFKDNQESINEIEENASKRIKVRIQSEKCKRYISRVVKNVEVKSSPMWMRERLLKCGIRPINNIVDITNYVMLEYGQPMHAFDYKNINGNEIIIRDAQNDEKLITLDNTECKLTSKDLVICDSEGPLALAGVMGGQNSGIDETTKEVVFESASFDGGAVRKSAKRYSIRTESSIRFEKGLNPRICEQPIDRACKLIEMLGAGKVLKGKVDIINYKQEDDGVEVDFQRINNFLGIDIKKEEMVEILNKLNFKVDGNLVYPPIYRIDIKNKADVAEEIARIYGYNNIPSTKSSVVTEGELTTIQKFERRIKEILCGFNIDEIYTYSFISPKNFDKLKLDKDSNLRSVVKIKNPLGEDTGVMRTTTIPSMLEVLSRNYNNKNQVARLFEISRIYLNNGEDCLPDEKQILTVGIYGLSDFFTIKGILVSLLNEIGVKEYEIKPHSSMPYHKYRAIQVFKDESLLAIAGEIDERVLKNYQINAKAYTIEIDMEKLLSFKEKEVCYTPLPKFPSTSRDLSLLCDRYKTAVEIESSIKKAGGELLYEVKLFDLYEGEQIEADKKSISYKLKFLSNDRTLIDKEVDEIIEQILIECKKIGVELRK